MSVPLFTPLTIRGAIFRNRIGVSPMCQYVAVDGMPSDWHLVHLGSRASGGAGLVMAEATAVVAEGRISPGDTGIWSDAHVEPFARIARFVRSQGAVPGIQLAHAGRKGSCEQPWLGGKAIAPEAGGWTTVAPSAIPFHPTDPVPVALDLAGIDAVVAQFEAAIGRSLQAGFETIEIHAAHGYLLHEFLSPLSNRREDDYGGSFENRIRMLVRVVDAARRLIPDAMPLFVRISATDWHEGGWDADQSVALAKVLKDHGVDLVDASSGALVPDAKIPVAPGYQVPFAARIKAEAGVLSAAVGLITEPAQANEIVGSGEADMVLLAREFLREPYWPLKAAADLGAEAPWPISYGYAVKRRHK